MLTKANVKLLLNVASIESASDVEVSVGTQPYDQAKLESLRRIHRGSYLLKRGGETGELILSVALKPGLSSLGTNTEKHALLDVPWLLAPLTIEALLGLFVSLQRPVLKWRPLRVLSQRPSNILPSQSGLPDWLQRRIVLDFETRTVRRRDRSSVVVLACGVRTRNVIDATCADVLETGVSLIGRYVATRRVSEDPRIQGSLALAGRVTGLRGSLLLLDDHGEGPGTIEASQAFLEPRNENMDWCVRHFLGSNAERIIEAAATEASRHLGGPERLALIRRTFDYLRNQKIDLAPGAPLVLGPYDQRTFAPKQLRIAVVCQAAYEGQVEAFLAKFLDGLPDVKTGRGEWIRAPYAKGFIRRYALEAPKVQMFTLSGASVEAYVVACREAIDTATNGGFEWNLAIVQIDQDFKELPGPDNPYFATKAVFLKQRVAVQEITLETMRFSNEQLVFALNNMSLATYAKIGGVPWHIVDDHPFTIFDEGNPGFRQKDGLKGVYAPERGVTIGLGDGESLVCFTGGRDVKQARHGMPQPTLLRLHRRSTFSDMTYLTRQAFDFSCHSWRMFTPAPLPITIHYSELIARLLTGLRHVPNWDPDTMLGPTSRTRWFL